MPAENAPSTTLRAGEHVAGRDFCDPAHTDGDLTTLRALRDAFRSQAGRHAASVLRFSDAIGEHVVAVPDWTALVRRRGRSPSWASSGSLATMSTTRASS